MGVNTLQIHKLTQFNDIGRMVAFSQANISKEFEIEDMDNYKMDSRTSTV